MTFGHTATPSHGAYLEIPSIENTHCFRYQHRRKSGKVGLMRLDLAEKMRVALLISFSESRTMRLLPVVDILKNLHGGGDMRCLRSCTAAFVLVGVSACGGGKSSSSTFDNPLSADLISALETRVTALETKVTQLQADVFVQKYGDSKEVVWFDPQDDKAYQAVQGPAGPLLVVLEKIEPYVDGFTVHMRIGNPTSAGFSGFKGTVKWGRKYDRTKNDTFNELSEKQIESKNFLPAGAWSVVNFNIGPAAPDQVRRIGFAPQFNSIQLRGPLL